MSYQNSPISKPFHGSSGLEVFCQTVTIKVFVKFTRNDYIGFFSRGKKHPPEVFYEKDVLKNCAKFTGKHLFQSLFLIKFIKKETLAKVFSCEFS